MFETPVQPAMSRVMADSPCICVGTLAILDQSLTSRNSQTAGLDDAVEISPETDISSVWIVVNLRVSRWSLQSLLGSDDPAARMILPSRPFHSSQRADLTTAATLRFPGRIAITRNDHCESQANWRSIIPGYNRTEMALEDGRNIDCRI